MTTQQQEVANKLYDMLNSEPTTNLNAKLDILAVVKEMFLVDIKNKTDKLKFELEELSKIIQEKF